MGIKVRNLPAIQVQDPKLAEALDDLRSAVDGVALRANVNPQGDITAPPDISQLNVIASGGIYDIRIFDDSEVTKGINYFVEYSTTPSFTNAIQIDLGASRNGREFLGNLILYFRTYSQYLGSAPSNPVYFGTAANPTAVTGGGSITGPTPQPSTGSGTSSSSGAESGQGFGIALKRS